MKRLFDFSAALIMLFFMLPVLAMFVALAALDTGKSGIFIQWRVGRCGKRFKLYKIRTLSDSGKISNFGKSVRKWKIDELPQLVNVLQGSMSFVGPRPDISGYYDNLEGENRKILELRPGITSEAAIKFLREDELLQQVENPQFYNDQVLFPEKIRLNLIYYYNQSFVGDLKIIFKTLKKIYEQ